MKYAVLALVALSFLAGWLIAQDLDTPKTGTNAEWQANGNGNGNGSMFDQLMAKLSQQRAEIEANRVTRWAFDDRYGWIWQLGRDGQGWGFSSANYYGDLSRQIAEAQFVKDNLTPAEYAMFTEQARQVWWALEAQGLN